MYRRHGRMSTVEMQIAERARKFTNIPWRNRKQRNRMRESCSSGSVGERGGNEPLYPEDEIMGIM
jgi:hypothetical protein